MNDILEIYKSDCRTGVISRKKTVGPELSLVKNYIDYKKNIHNFNGPNNLAIFIEPKINNAYPDIIFAEYNPDDFGEWKSVRNELTMTDFKILYHIHTSSAIDNTNLLKDIGLKWKDIALSTEKLLDSELIIRKNQQWVISDVNKIRLKKIEAIEAKINKWEEVLQQAILNKNFASESYALLKQSKCPSTEIIRKFKNLGVGLCFENNNEFQLLSKPTKCKLPGNFNSLYLNELIGRTIFN